MKSIVFVAIAAVLTIACVVEGPTAPTKKPQPDPEKTVSIQSAETITGGKACVLSPADPVNIPVGHYVCPNGIEFDQACPVTGCPRVASQPKKH